MLLLIPEFFDLLVSALHAVTKDDAGLPAVLLGYKLKVYHLSGFAPGLSSCIQCGKAHVAQGSAQSVLFDIRQGGALCQTCTRHGTPDRLEPLAAPHSRVKIGIDRLVWMQHLLSADFLEYAEDPIPEGMWNELDGLMRLYEKQHVLHGRTLKTDSMLREFIG